MSNEPEEQHPLSQGVSVQQLEKFCDLFTINMYSYDKTDTLIEYYKCKNSMAGKTNSGRDPLVFIVYDGHFNPVADKAERKSKVCRAANMGKVCSADIDNFEKKN